MSFKSTVGKKLCTTEVFSSYDLAELLERLIANAKFATVLRGQIRSPLRGDKVDSGIGLPMVLTVNVLKLTLEGSLDEVTVNSVKGSHTL